MLQLLRALFQPAAVLGDLRLHLAFGCDQVFTAHRAAPAAGTGQRDEQRIGVGRLVVRLESDSHERLSIQRENGHFDPGFIVKPGHPLGQVAIRQTRGEQLAEQPGHRDRSAGRPVRAMIRRRVSLAS